MSMARQMAAVGQAATAVVEEDLVRSLRTGLCFQAKIQELGDLKLVTDLSIDPRASHYIQIRKTVGIKLIANEQLEGAEGKFQVLPNIAPENVTQVHRRYFVEELTDKDAT